MGRFSIPSSPARSVVKIDEFKGVDLNSSPSNVAVTRSPNAPNMMRDVPGKVRKRQGYEKTGTYGGRINGVHRLLVSVPDKEADSESTEKPEGGGETPEKPESREGTPENPDSGGGTPETPEGDGQTPSPPKMVEKILVHAGTALYLDSQKIYEGMADERSCGRQFYGKLFIFDGKKALCYGEFEKEKTEETPEKTAADGDAEKEEKPEKEFMVKTLEDAAYIPTIIVSRNPSGGGETLEPLNLLGQKWKESFLSNGSATVYQLTTKGLDADEVEVRIMTKEGEWTDKKEGSDFTVDRKAGTVTFKTAPGNSPVKGYDNVEITAAKAREGYADKINKCRIVSLFGVNGSMDRMFISGNPDFPNQDWYCRMADGFFWGDLWYSVLGQDGSAIVGYSIINDRLAVHKNIAEEGRNVILRKGEIQTQASVDGKSTTETAVFPIVGTLSGRGALGKYAFGYLGSEPLFLTDVGVMAITAADLTGEKYSQNRSFFINNALAAEKDLADSFAFVWRDFYLLSTGKGRVYLLDGLQKQYEKNSPYSHFQYECYFWENVPARVFWEDAEGRLCFGDEKGNTFRFYDDVTNQKSYNDDGAAIPARWDTPELMGKLFYKNKNFRRVDVMLAPAIATGVSVYAQIKGVWGEIFNSGARAMYFDFTHINFELINFSTDDTPRTMGTKIKIKKVDKVAFSLRNERYNEPFGIYMLSLEYTENGNYKG